MHLKTQYKNLFLFLILNFAGLYLVAQNVNATFQVDMSNETVSSNGVHIAGNFQSVAGLGGNWNPGSTRIEDPDGDNIYSITVSIPPGTYEYKFINGNAWGADENPQGDCSVGSTNNRQITIGSSDVVITPVPFNMCAPSVRFSVNLKGQNISPNGIHLMGDFQEAAGYADNWNPASIKMEDVNGDGTYEANIVIPPGEYHFIFINGDDASERELLTSECAFIGPTGYFSRRLVVNTSSQNLTTYCFGSCDECDPKLDTNLDSYWWNDAVFYEIFVRSFYDSDNDGIGDFKGAIEKLDYLNDGDPDTDSDLGITGIWLMPMMESPSYHGYDVTDYYKVEPDYGTMEDFEEFIDEAHKRGIKVIIDLVLNHTSNQHPWFTQSANDNNDFRDWYVWSENNPGFSGPWGQGVWHNNGGDFYYGLFWGGMPDLNYNHPPVKEEMFKVIDFWMDKGVDGFRLDAIKYLVEDGTKLENTEETFTLLEEFRDVYDANNLDAFTIGEVWSNTASIIPYVQNERLNVCFEFDLAGSILNAVNNQNAQSVQQQMDNVQASYPALQYGTFLTNHDMDRVYNQIGSSTTKMKLAASIYLTLPGIPYLYYGEEVKMVGTGAHENIRRPMQWTDDTYGGFSEVSPWNNLGPNYTTNNVQSMEADEGSLLNHYKKLIKIRNENAALRKGNYLNVESKEANVLSYMRMHEENAILMISNLGIQSLESSLSLKASKLSPGEYFPLDLYTQETLDPIIINENGGFENWIPSQDLDGRTTMILKLSSELQVNTEDIETDEMSYSIYPNPTKSLVNIMLHDQKFEGASLNILTLEGKEVFRTHIESMGIEIDTQLWQEGVYLVQIQHEGMIYTQRLIIL